MDEKRVDIKIYTVIFFLILAGFIGFLVYEWVRESDYKEKTAPKERFKKNRNNTLELLTIEINKA